MFRFAFLLALLWAPVFGAAAADSPRTFTFRYEVTVDPAEGGTFPLDVWIPLAVENQSQRVLSEKIVSPVPGVVGSEGEYGNRYWHATIATGEGLPASIVVETTVLRSERRASSGPGHSGGTADREAHRRYLGPNSRVVVGHPVLEPILAEIRAASPGADRATRARAIYDWVVDNVEYKKVGDGWGNGDTFWACNERYGNCTDFHALFISLARSEGIPARFEIGFPVPENRSSGQIGGYHCWVEFHLPETGWFPIDASEAFKHPEKRDLFFGTHPPDRIHFSTGRDLRLGDQHRGGPLNYFVYPYAEVGGRALEGGITKQFSYREHSGAAE